MVVDSLTYASQLDALDDVSNNNLYSFTKLDISNQNSLEDLLATYEPDYIFNLAAETHVDRSIDSPDIFIKTNILGTYSLLEATLKYWEKSDLETKANFRLLHVSTDEVFGDLEMNEPPFQESDKYKPSSPYSATKASSDHLVRAWHRTYQLPVILTNCSNNFGPFQFYEKLIPLMIIKAMRGEELPVYGSGLQVRDWLFVEDHTDALIEVILKGQVGENYNIGASCEKTNLEVVEAICNLLDETFDTKPSNIVSYKDLITFVADRPGHDKRYAINSTKIEKNLGWKPKESFESALKKTILWYAERSNSIEYDALRIGKGR